MKKLIATATFIGLIALTGNVLAQEDTRDKKETEEIIIRNKGDKEMKLNVEINGDSILVNGKPMAEFKDDQVTINKRKIIVRDGDNSMFFDLGPEGNNFHID